MAKAKQFRKSAQLMRKQSRLGMLGAPGDLGAGAGAGGTGGAGGKPETARSRMDVRRHTESTLFDPRLRRLADSTSDTSNDLARALRQVAMLSKDSLITPQQKAKLKMLVLLQQKQKGGGAWVGNVAGSSAEDESKAARLNDVLARGDAAKLQQLLAESDGIRVLDRDPRKAGGVRFAEDIAITVGHVHDGADYDRTAIYVEPRVERRLPPLGEALLRTSSYGRHQWKPIFWIFDGKVLYLFNNKADFTSNKFAIKELEFEEGHFVTFISGKQYKNSGWIYSFKLMLAVGGGNARQELKLGHPENRPLRRCFDAMKGAAGGATFSRAHAKHLEEAEFIKSVAVQDRKNVNFGEGVVGC